MTTMKRGYYLSLSVESGRKNIKMKGGVLRSTMRQVEEGMLGISQNISVTNWMR